ncbi:peptide chain release factor N(5)-glutamine methyltransferase [Prevotella communis]|uniref:peptide chain release factor N(5)-glutamine methyltransferase n=1 Tax=Prevotella communis TaxID=2913614 RepID=UPI001EDC2AF6|nr:peptide chain release factor N(5)-glutamine methyltransferase [Prevotella communis]UKK57155.1 peptide chain release factor N(5)-glutamine methyltransferase [Prevotella communis]UKK62602.1 peptide chain release factor N(5)-glutamine methyltransferase [Prevotella communis]UKK65427.1 peptide chain release factor N(5)-glutamine methyltransferase [Prevotella communis]
MTYNELWRQLTQVYDDYEAKAIARMVYEIRFGLMPSDLFIGKDTQLSTDDQKLLAEITQRLLTGEPVQYVLGEAEFGGRTFHVEPGVLIPRPETYELCQWIMEERRGKKEEGRNTSILDIGTGSGCIACTLAAELADAEVTAWDISDDALRIATENAKRTNVHVSFKKVDVLNTSLLNRERPATGLDIIVSNPPYICNKERATMERNVLEHEPELALFVPDDDPLLFYRTIARFAAKTLNPGGALYFEINPLHVSEMQQMLSEEGFSHTEIRNDQFGKQRFTKSCL